MEENTPETLIKPVNTPINGKKERNNSAFRIQERARSSNDVRGLKRNGMAYPDSETHLEYL